MVRLRERLRLRRAPDHPDGEAPPARRITGIARGLSLAGVVTGIGVAAIAAVFILEMSRSAPRTAGSDHVGAPVFAATVPGGGTVCQPISPPSVEVAAVQLVIGTYGRPVPPLSLRFVNAQGRAVAAGSRPSQVGEGALVVPVRRLGDLSAATQACLKVGGSHNVVLGGEAGPGGSELVDGKHQPGNVSLIYLRRGSESWWQLLPALETRFGLGKAPFFGDWTLPVMALLLLAAWIGAIRLISRRAV